MKDAFAATTSLRGKVIVNAQLLQLAEPANAGFPLLLGITSWTVMKPTILALQYQWRLAEDEVTSPAD